MSFPSFSSNPAHHTRPPVTPPGAGALPADSRVSPAVSPSLASIASQVGSPGVSFSSTQPPAPLTSVAISTAGQSALGLGGSYRTTPPAVTGVSASVTPTIPPVTGMSFSYTPAGAATSQVRAVEFGYAPQAPSAPSSHVSAVGFSYTPQAPSAPSPHVSAVGFSYTPQAPSAPHAAVTGIGFPWAPARPAPSQVAGVGFPYTAPAHPPAPGTLPAPSAPSATLPGAAPAGPPASAATPPTGVRFTRADGGISGVRLTRQNTHVPQAQLHIGSEGVLGKRAIDRQDEARYNEALEQIENTIAEALGINTSNPRFRNRLELDVNLHDQVFTFRNAAGNKVSMTKHEFVRKHMRHLREDEALSRLDRSILTLRVVARANGYVSAWRTSLEEETRGISQTTRESLGHTSQALQALQCKSLGEFIKKGGMDDLYKGYPSLTAPEVFKRVAAAEAFRAHTIAKTKEKCKQIEADLAKPTIRAATKAKLNTQLQKLQTLQSGWENIDLYAYFTASVASRNNDKATAKKVQADTEARIRERAQRNNIPFSAADIRAYAREVGALTLSKRELYFQYCQEQHAAPMNSSPTSLLVHAFKRKGNHIQFSDYGMPSFEDSAEAHMVGKIFKDSYRASEAMRVACRATNPAEMNDFMTENPIAFPPTPPETFSEKAARAWNSRYNPLNRLI